MRRNNMSSTNKTSLGLNIWEASDKPVRQDFVNDNVIIDEKISELNHNYNDIVNEKISKLNSNLTNLVATDVKYDSTGATITATNVQSAIKQLDSKISNMGNYSGNLNDVPYISNTLLVYRVAGGSTNSPTSNHGILETMYIDTAPYAIQRYTSLNASPQIWVRSKISGTWNAWVEK